MNIASRVPILILRAFGLAGGLLLLSFVMLICLVETNCSRHGSMRAPDGRHVAAFDFVGSGALGEDYVTIRLRRVWSLRSEIAYHGEGRWDFKKGVLSYPKVHWRDDGRFEIDAWDVRGCKEWAGGVQVVCRAAR